MAVQVVAETHLCPSSCDVRTGFFIPYASMPVWWSWGYWLNPLSYMIYGVVTR